MQTSTHRACLALACALAARAAVAQAPQTIVVEGRKEPVEARSSLLGDDVPSAEVPWSVHVLRAGDFTRAADDRLESALSAAGLVAIGVNQAGLGTAVVARGFDLSTRLYVNGHPDLLRLFVRDLATVDRVEVLKGQYALLYGQGSPGATINHVSKRPAGTGQVSGSVAFGSHGLRRLEVDVDSAPAGDGRPVTFRLAAALQRADTWQANVGNDRQALLASVAFEPKRGTSLRLEGEWMRNERPYSFGTVYALGRFHYDRSYVSPAAESDRRYGRVGLYADHALTADWSLHAAYSAGRVNRDETLAGFFTISGPTTLSSYYRELVDRYRQHNLRLEVRGRFAAGATRHALTAGVQQDRARFDFEGPQNIGGYTIDIENPNVDLDFGALPLAPRTQSERNRERAVYVQDRIALDEHWRLVAGLRRAELKIHAGTIATRSTVTDVAVTTPTVGAVWLPTPQVSAHLSRSEAYEPNRGNDRFGGFIAPRRSVQHEAGARYASADRALTGSATVFDIEQRNLTMPDPLDRTALVAVGTVRSRGIELAARATPLPGLPRVSANAALTLQRVRVADKTSATQGDQLPGVPRRLGALGAQWLAAPGTNVWANVAFVGRRQGDPANTFTAAPYERLDAGVGHSLGTALGQPLDLSLAVVNALDRRYIEALTGADNAYQGDRRRITVALRWRLP